MEIFIARQLSFPLGWRTGSDCYSQLTHVRRGGTGKGKGRITSPSRELQASTSRQLCCAWLTGRDHPFGRSAGRNRSAHSLKTRLSLNIKSVFLLLRGAYCKKNEGKSETHPPPLSPQYSAWGSHGNEAPEPVSLAWEVLQRAPGLAVPGEIRTPHTRSSAGARQSVWFLGFEIFFPLLPRKGRKQPFEEALKPK